MQSQPQATEDLRIGVRDAVRAARLAYVFRGHPVSLLIASLLALLTAIVLLTVFPLWRLSIWYGAFILVSIYRRLVHRRYERALAGGSLDLRHFERQAFAGAMCAGVMWGSLCIVMFPADPTLQVFLGFVLSGVAAAAVTSLAADRAAAFAFVLCAVVPLGVRLALRGDLVGISMSLMVIAFLIVVSNSIRRLHAQIGELVASRADADAHLEELRRTQRDVTELNHRLTMATQMARLGVWEWDLRSTRLVWDERMYEMYAVAPDEMLTYELHRQRIHPHDIARLERRLRELRDSGGEADEEFRVLWPHGEERFLRTSARIERDPDGAASRIVGVNWDITEVKRLERLKDEFVSIVSHELRTPLTSIRGSLGLIGGGAVGDIPERAQQLIRMADRNAGRLAALIDDLLDMDKIESGKLALDAQVQPLMPLIDQALEANAGYAHLRQVTLQLVARHEALVKVDTLRLLQVLANLLSNAAKFSPAGLPITVAVMPCARGVRVEVSDRGPGIATQFQQRIFSKFAQGDSSDTRAKGGTGLGLAISKALIEQMHGVIGYHSLPGAGATFYIELPEAEAVPGAA